MVRLNPTWVKCVHTVNSLSPVWFLPLCPWCWVCLPGRLAHHRVPSIGANLKWWHLLWLKESYFDKHTSNLIFPLEKCHRREMMGRLEASLSKMNVSSVFYVDSIKRARKYFKKNNAVIAPDGIYITYNSGILAPHKVGAMKIFLIRISNIH